MKWQKRSFFPENTSQSGQGIIEYSVIIVLVVIIVISFIALFGVDMYNRFRDNQQNGNGEQTIQATREPVFHVMEIGTTIETMDTETIIVDNCPDDGDYDPEIERDRSIEYQLVIDDQLASNLVPRGVSSLQTYYGITNRAVEERSYPLNLEAPPESIVEYTIDWQNIWKEGEIVLTEPDGSERTYNYRALTDLEFEITNLEQSSCDPQPEP